MNETPPTVGDHYIAVLRNLLRRYEPQYWSALNDKGQRLVRAGVEAVYVECCENGVGDLARRILATVAETRRLSGE